MTKTRSSSMAYQAWKCLNGAWQCFRLGGILARGRSLLTPFAHTHPIITFARCVCWFSIVCTSWVPHWVQNHKTTALFCCESQLLTWHCFLYKPHLEKSVGPHFVKIGRICIVYVLNCALFQVLPSSQVNKTLKKWILHYKDYTNCKKGKFNMAKI